MLRRRPADAYRTAQWVCISVSFESCNCFSGCPTLQQSLAGVMARETCLFLNDTQIIMLHHIVSVIDFQGPWLTSSWNNKAVTGDLWATPKPLRSGLPHIIEGALERQHPMTRSG